MVYLNTSYLISEVFFYCKIFVYLGPKVKIDILTLIIMNTGKVKFFQPEKGFGFIIDDKTGKELFVHASGLVDNISQGDQVSFDLVDGKKGQNCVDVKIIG